MMWCFFYKLWISHILDADSSPGRWLQRHMHRCGKCRGFYKENLILQERLREDVPVGQKAYSLFLQERVTSVLHQAKDTPEKYAPLISGWDWRRWSAIAACLILGIVLVYQVHLEIKNEPEPITIHQIADLEDWAEGYEKFIAMNSTDLTQIIETPLAGEYEKLVADVESATNFLWSRLNIDVKNANGG